MGTSAVDVLQRCQGQYRREARNRVAGQVQSSATIRIQSTSVVHNAFHADGKFKDTDVSCVRVDNEPAAKPESRLKRKDSALHDRSDDTQHIVAHRDGGGADRERRARRTPSSSAPKTLSEPLHTVVSPASTGCCITRRQGNDVNDELHNLHRTITEGRT
jgi:hypothetical protein